MTVMVCRIMSKLAWRSALPMVMLLALGGFAEGTKAAKLKVLVICTGNSARSQMTAGFLKSWDTRLDIYSAGTAPAPRINPYAVRAMKEVGIDAMKLIGTAQISPARSVSECIFHFLIPRRQPEPTTRS